MSRRFFLVMILSLFLTAGLSLSCTAEPTSDPTEEGDDNGNSDNEDNETPDDGDEETPGDGDEETPGDGDEEEPDPEDPDPDGDLDTNTQDIIVENAVRIAFTTSGVNIENDLEGQGVTLETDGAHVVITSTVTDKQVNYVLSGFTEDGSVKIYGSYQFGLYLNGADITNPSGAAINIQSKKEALVTIVDLTNNRLSDGATYDYVTGEDMKGTFFSEGTLTFDGNGTLQVSGANKHAICSDDYLTINNGYIYVTAAASDALHIKNNTVMEGGLLKTTSVGEGIDCDNGIFINGGKLTITTTGQKGHGLKSGLATRIDGGTLNITVGGEASKCVNSTGDVTITSGTMTFVTTGNAFYDTSDSDISSPAGIKCDANFVMDGGTLTLNSSGKGAKNINVDGTLTINDGTISATTTGGQFVTSTDDTAAKAIKSDGNLTVNGGKITIRTSGVEAEGLESKATLTITGGDIDIEAYDDCINASTHIEITGGYVYCNSTTNDAIDSNGTLSISGGTIIAAGAGSPEAGFDCDNSRFAITGGTIVGIGGSTSTPTTNASTQRSVIYNATSGTISTVSIQNASGTQILAFKLPKTYNQRMTMLFSSPELLASTTYSIYTGGTISGGTDYHGLYTGASWSGGSSAGTFTTSNMVTTVGSTGGGGRP